jgi:poly-gamma-glutamate synthesis protein (capsule biosynthesis protein)
MDENIRISIVGDCSNWNMRHLSTEMIPDDIRDYIEKSDIFLFNLEGPIIDDSIKAEGPIKNTFVKYLLSLIGKLQPPVSNTESILSVLKLSEINVACLANNHILDAGAPGIDFTLKSLKENGFLLLGAGKNLADASEPLLIDVKGKKIGILNYNFIGWRKFGFFINIFGATDNKAGANSGSENKIIQDISNLKGKADHIILLAHIGKELREELSQKNIGFLEKLDVNLVIVHHAHIAQSINSKKVISCGDFLFNYPGHLPDKRKCQIIIADIKNGIAVNKERIRIESGVCNAK